MVRIRPGEAELGAQRWCTGCREWWPVDREFWYYFSRIRGGREVYVPAYVCRACWDGKRRGAG